MSAERILIIEDDPEIQEMLKYAFEKEGWKLVQVKTGEEGLKELKSNGADCVILDIMLPGQDGFKILKKIRELDSCRLLPVIMCTARGEEADIVTGLELGADDYVVKPYSPRVLAARIRVALRRKEAALSPGANGAENTGCLEQGRIRVDVEKHKVFLEESSEESSIDLSATEFTILVQFMKYPDVVFTRQKLIAAVHGDDYPVTDRSVDVQIMGLRKKLKEAGEMIETIRGVGYRFTTECN